MPKKIAARLNKIAMDLHQGGLYLEAHRVCKIRDGILAGVTDLFSERKALPHYNYTLSQLESMPTLSTSQGDDLKVDEDGVRVWLSRMDVEDGMPYHSQVTVEVLDEETGRWEIQHTYQANQG